MWIKLREGEHQVNIIHGCMCWVVETEKRFVCRKQPPCDTPRGRIEHHVTRTKGDQVLALHKAWMLHHHECTRVERCEGRDVFKMNPSFVGIIHTSKLAYYMSHESKNNSQC